MASNQAYEKSAEVILDIIAPTEERYVSKQDNTKTATDRILSESVQDEANDLVFKFQKKKFFHKNPKNYQYFKNNKGMTLACINSDNLEKTSFKNLISSMIEEIQKDHIIITKTGDNMIKFGFKIYRPINENKIFYHFIENIIDLIIVLNNHTANKPYFKMTNIWSGAFEIAIFDKRSSAEGFGEIEDIKEHIASIISISSLVNTIDNKILIGNGINADIILTGIAKEIFTVKETDHLKQIESDEDHIIYANLNRDLKMKSLNNQEIVFVQS